MIDAGDPGTFDPDGSRADIGFDIELLNYQISQFYLFQIQIQVADTKLQCGGFPTP